METYRRKAEYQNRDSAERYLGRFTRAQGKKEHEATIAALTRALDNVAGTKSILDVPCGAGRFTDFLRDRDYFYVGADVSQEMLEVLASAPRSPGPALSVLRCDAEALPFKDGAFDCVACIRFLNQYVPTSVREKMLREMRRVSRKWLVVQSHRLRSMGPFGHLKVFVKEILGGDVGKYRIRNAILKQGWKEQARIPVEGKRFYVGVYSKV